MNESVNIVESMGGFVRSNVLITGKDIKAVSKKAEEIFSQMIRENDNEVFKADIQNFLDEGYYEQGDWSINITWPHYTVEVD